MKILLSGANGQLGREFCKLWAQKGLEYDASDVDDMDITNLEAVRDRIQKFKPALVVNCAAYNAVDKAETDWESAYQINTLGPKHLAIAADELGIPLMHFSTDFVFDGTKTGKPYKVADTPAPINRYGESKLQGEQMVQSYAKLFFLVRLSWVFGDGNNFVKKVLQWASKNKQLRIVKDQVSRPAYTRDLVPVLNTMIEQRAYGIWQLANDGWCSRFEWAKEIVRLSGLSTEVLEATSKEFDSAAKRPDWSVMDISAIQDLTGQLPPTWQDATRRYISEIKA